MSNFFVGILVQRMTPKGHFEINRPLVISSVWAWFLYAQERLEIIQEEAGTKATAGDKFSCVFWQITFDPERWKNNVQTRFCCMMCWSTGGPERFGSSPERSNAPKEKSSWHTKNTPTDRQIHTHSCLLAWPLCILRPFQINRLTFMKSMYVGDSLQHQLCVWGWFFFWSIALIWRAAKAFGTTCLSTHHETFIYLHIINSFEYY